MRQLEEGLRGSWHPGVVIDVTPGFRAVRYDNLLLTEGTAEHLVEKIPVGRLSDDLLDTDYTLDGEADPKTPDEAKGDHSRSLDSGSLNPSLPRARADGLKSSSSSGSFPLEIPARSLLRPRPPPCPHPRPSQWKAGTAVDFYGRDSWWEGILCEDVGRAGMRARVNVEFPDEATAENVSVRSLRLSQEWSEATGQWRMRPLPAGILRKFKPMKRLQDPRNSTQGSMGLAAYDPLTPTRTRKMKRKAGKKAKGKMKSRIKTAGGGRKVAQTDSRNKKTRHQQLRVREAPVGEAGECAGDDVGGKAADVLLDANNDGQVQHNLHQQNGQCQVGQQQKEHREERKQEQGLPGQEQQNLHRQGGQWQEHQQQKERNTEQGRQDKGHEQLERPQLEVRTTKLQTSGGIKRDQCEEAAGETLLPAEHPLLTTSAGSSGHLPASGAITEQAQQQPFASQDRQRVLRSGEKSTSAEDRLNSPRRKKSRKALYPPGKDLARLMDLGIVQEGEEVEYRDMKDKRVLLAGVLSRAGIICNCCQRVYNLSGFEQHTGVTYRRPSANIFLPDGRSLAICKLKADAMVSGLPVDDVLLAGKVSSAAGRHGKGARKPERVKGVPVAAVAAAAGAVAGEVECVRSGERRKPEYSDALCKLCGEGGELLCCDSCPATLHLKCAGLEVSQGRRLRSELHRDGTGLRE